MRKNVKFGTKLLIAFLVVGIVPFAIVVAMSLTNSSRALKKQAFNQLAAVQKIKKNQIRTYFKNLVNTIHAINGNPTTFQAMLAFEEAFRVDEGRTGGFKWAIIAEISKAEAFSSVHALERMIALLAFVGIAAIIATAWLVTRGVTRPVNRIIASMNDGAYEVRNLALRAAEAAKSTSSLIEETAKRISDGSERLMSTNRDFDQVAVMAVKVTELISGISTTANRADQILKPQAGVRLCPCLSCLA